MGIPQHRRDEILARHRNGEHLPSLAKSLGLDPSTVRKNIIAWGGTVLNPARRYTPLQKQQAIDMYTAGATIEVVAAAFGVTFATMKNNLHRWGAAVRRTGPDRKWAIDERYFEHINTPAKAYWLGFLFADGSVVCSKKGQWTIRIGLAKIDLEHLDKFLTAIKCGDRVRPMQGGRAGYVCVGSAVMARDLISHGCVPRKTYGHTWPSLSEPLLHHFIRGYFDGDGSLYPTPTNGGWRFDIVGCPAFITYVQRQLVTHVNVNLTKLFPRGVVSSVRYSGGEDVERIMRWLYETTDAAIRLDRKYEQYLQMCKRPTNATRTYEHTRRPRRKSAVR